MHMGSGFVLRRGGFPIRPRSGQDRPYNAKDKRAAAAGCGPGMPGPYGWLCLCVGADSISARRRAAAEVYGPSL